MNIAKLYTTNTTVTTGAKDSYDIQAAVNKGPTANVNNVGGVQVIGGSTVSLEGSTDGSNWMTLATGLTSTAGASIFLFPYMRVNVTSAAGTALDVNLVW